MSEINNTDKINLFEYATRKKLRWPYKGQLSVEDLWDLSLTALDSIYKTLKAKLKESDEESLLTEKSPVDTDLNVQIEIVKHIVEYKLNKTRQQKLAKEKADKRHRIMEIMAEKADEDLRNTSIEDLRKMLDSLD